MDDFGQSIKIRQLSSGFQLEVALVPLQISEEILRLLAYHSRGGGAAPHEERATAKLKDN